MRMKLRNKATAFILPYRSLNKHKIPNKITGSTKLQTDISIKNNFNLFFTASIDNLREFWETTSNKLEYLQMSKQVAQIQENENIIHIIWQTIII